MYDDCDCQSNLESLESNSQPSSCETRNRKYASVNIQSKKRVILTHLWTGRSTGGTLSPGAPPPGGAGGLGVGPPPWFRPGGFENPGHITSDAPRITATKIYPNLPTDKRRQLGVVLRVDNCRESLKTSKRQSFSISESVCHVTFLTFRTGCES